MNSVFLLIHSYESEGYDEIKTIGIYSSQKKAENVVEEYKNILGFKDYPLDCFYIAEYEIDKNHWEEGFVKVY